MEEGDLIRIDIPERILELVGVGGQYKTPEEIDEILNVRRAAWKPKMGLQEKGVLKLYARCAASPMKGGYME